MTAVSISLPIDPEWARWEHRYTWHLDQVPGLIDVIRGGRVPLGSSLKDSAPVSGSKSDMNPLPFRLDAVDQADELWAALIEYALEVADKLDADRPHVLRATWFQRGNVAGIRASATGREVSWAASEVVGWLVGNLHAIASLTALQDSEDHLFSLVRKARARHTTVRPRRARPRLCMGKDENGVVHGCGEVAVLIDWAEIPGGIGPAEPVGACQTCGQTYTWRKA